jgi:NADH-quinone oxidoreductase subunit M
MYFMIGVWGGGRKIYAAVKFVLFTMFGSLLMLLAIIKLYIMTSPDPAFRTTDLMTVMNMPITPDLQVWLFLAFALAFAIKVPLFPFHTWLPDAHVEAPTAGSVILAGVLLKMGTYGFLRFCLPLFPDATLQFVPLIRWWLIPRWRTSVLSCWECSPLPPRALPVRFCRWSITVSPPAPCFSWWALSMKDGIPGS